ncbi:MAG: hypothetical protein WCV90_00490 [Candidatus Woesearchaeota archaeon]|jgi:hypothetical protein
MELTYESATINHSGSIVGGFKEEPAFIVGSAVRFTRNGCYVSAQVPTGIWDKPRIKDQYALPLVELVSRDLATIDDLFPILKELAVEKKAPDILMYSREPEAGAGFKIYDNHSIPPGPVFPTLLGIKRTDLRFLNPEYNDLLTLGEGVDQEKNNLVHVKGDTLRSALERAIAIYRFAERLRKI